MQKVADARSDQCLRCPLPESLATVECINGEHRPGWELADAQDDLDLRIIAHVRRQSFSLNAAVLYCD